MRLVMTLLVRDEVELIRANLEFHLARGVDHVLVTDNGSVDGTRDIVEEYARAGVATVLDERSFDFQQDVWVTRMLHLAADQLGAECVLNNDADEFWCPGAGGTLPDAFLRARCDVLYVPRYELLPTRELSERPDYAFWQNQLRPTGQRPGGQRSKVMFRMPGALSVGPGNHEVYFPNARRARSSDLTICHFPYRSFAAFERKVRQGGQALRRNPEWPETWGVHWREWYRAYEAGRLREAFDAQVPTEREAAEGLARGTLVRDESFSTSFAGAAR
jgi:hypothetical protein